ncbi:MAG: hypothetical protein PWQ06_2274 [Anaerophaga sp.]|jgi:hypothetical protein|nr:hypothetical protein [Anaerophaga sp.]
MDTIKILKDEEVLNEVSMDTIKGGNSDSTPPQCCYSNTACNVNSKQIETT